MKITWRLRLKWWLIGKLIERGLPVEIEARHGAFRTRAKFLWHGGLMRVDIPLQQKHGVTSTPMGDITDPQKFIDGFTAVKPIHQEIEDLNKQQKEADEKFLSAPVRRGKACPFCGHTKWSDEPQ